MSKPYLECVGCGRDYPISTVNARCECDEPLEVKFNLGSLPRNWFQTQRSGFFAGRYAPFYPYLDPDPLFSLGEGQTSLLRSVFLVEKLGFKELFFKNSSTLDHVLENPYPPSGNQILRKLKANNGLLLKVNNDSILTAMRLLSQEGIFAQPASATALAGLMEVVNKKMIPPGSRVVVVVTGSGLKYPLVLKEFDVSPVSVKLDQLPQALEAVLI